jgi:ATP-dependent DNA helicase DinG
VHEQIAGPLADQGLALYAQHVDPLEVGALVDIFRAEEDACLLGTDAVRDGVDVPGRSLRLLVFRSHAVAAAGHAAQGPPGTLRRQGL